MSMSTISAVNDHVLGLVETALQQLRLVAQTLEDTTIPHILPFQRNAAIAFVKRADRGKIFSASTLYDVDSLILQLRREAESGTHHGWQADENHISGGWPVTYFDSRASALNNGADALQKLREAIASCLDAARSYEIASQLTCSE